ncbi:Asp-tRNA(Asn)/Glu-tRNA(Gln) amidotransferase subunit GatC [Candidatus Latescibacterota bacterium]
MPVTKKDVEAVAALARLTFTEQEKERFTVTLNDILAYMDKLSELDTGDVEPLTHILPVENVTRLDEVKPSFDQDTALANAPKHVRGFFVIPRVIE